VVAEARVLCVERREAVVSFGGIFFEVVEATLSLELE
jgi:hypothetical protein